MLRRTSADGAPQIQKWDMSPHELRDFFTGAGPEKSGDREVAFQLHLTF